MSPPGPPTNSPAPTAAPPITENRYLRHRDCVEYPKITWVMCCCSTIVSAVRTPANCQQLQV